MKFAKHFTIDDDTVRLVTRDERAAIRVYQLFVTTNVAPASTNYVKMLSKREGTQLDESCRFYLNRSPSLYTPYTGEAVWELEVDAALWIMSPALMTGYVICEYIARDTAEEEARAANNPSSATDNIAGEIEIPAGDGI